MLASHLRFVALVAMFLSDSTGPARDAAVPTAKPRPVVAATHDRSAAAPALDVLPPLPDLPVVMVQEQCPKRDELACAALAQDGCVSLLFRRGKKWSAPVVVCERAGQLLGRNFDLKYEQNSGRALVVCYDALNGRLVYRVADPARLHDERALALPPGMRANYVAMKPSADSDDVLLLVTGPAEDGRLCLVANAWNGRAWHDWIVLNDDLEADTLSALRMMPADCNRRASPAAKEASPPRTPTPDDR